MFAYPDSKCIWGYMTICDNCKKERNIPRYVNINSPIVNPPAVGKKQQCEICGKTFILKSAGDS